MPEQIPRYLNNGFGYVPQSPGGGRFDAQEGLSQFISTIGQLSGMMGPLGSLIGTGLNFMGMNMQNRAQARMYEQYQSPQARMQQMVAAGINPNTAAAGIAGSAAPSMQAATAPDSMSLGQAIGNSVNNALQAEMQAAEVEKTKEETDYIKSKNEGQNIANAWANQEHAAALRKMVADGTVSEANARIISADAEYAEANAYEHFTQTMMNTQIMVQELANMQQDYVNKMAQYQLMLAQIGKTEAEIRKIFSDIGVNSALIGKINAETRNIDAGTAATWVNIEGQQIMNDINRVTLAFKQDSLKTMQLYGYRDDLSVQGNYMRLVAQGKQDDANNLMNDTYQFVTGTTTSGKYAGQENARKWISTITGGLMTVGGVILMATGAGAVPGAALTGVGLTTMSKSINSGKQPGYSTGYDFSHIPD